MEVFERNSERIGDDSKFREELYSNAVRAGKRTYFFDVKSTRRDEFYLTITESKKQFDQDGNFHFEKHKIFLYKEDFEKFSEGLFDAISFIDQNQQSIFENEGEYENKEFSEDAVLEEILEEVGADKDFTKLEFDNL